MVKDSKIPNIPEMPEKRGNDDNGLSPELKDICEMLNRYVEANKQKVCFVANFVAFRKSKPGTKCAECGDECDHEIAEDATTLMAYGDKETLRLLINELRDAVEDTADSDGFVNV